MMQAKKEEVEGLIFNKNQIFLSLLSLLSIFPNKKTTCVCPLTNFRGFLTWLHQQPPHTHRAIKRLSALYLLKHFRLADFRVNFSSVCGKEKCSIK